MVTFTLVDVYNNFVHALEIPSKDGETYLNKNLILTVVKLR